MTQISDTGRDNLVSWLTSVLKAPDTADRMADELIAQLDLSDPEASVIAEVPASKTRSGHPETYTFGADELDVGPSVLTAEITDDTVRVRDPRGGIWYPDEDAEAEIWGELVVCESPDGYSLHAPGSSDEEIASGDAPPLVTGPWIDDAHTVPASAYDEARRVLAVHICEREPMRGQWQD